MTIQLCVKIHCPVGKSKMMILLQLYAYRGKQTGSGRVTKILTEIIDNRNFILTNSMCQSPS